MDRSDDTLMAAIAEGDSTAFSILAKRWERRIYAFAWRSLGSADDARDITQETFIRVFQHAAAYKPGGRFASWLFRIAGNLIRNEVRRRKIRRILSLDFGDEAEHLHSTLADPTPLADAKHEREHQLREMHAAILKLPERQRIALLLKRFENLKQSEIAEILEVSEKAVESLLSRAMATLRRELRPRR